MYSGFSLVSALEEVQNILVCSEEFWLHLLVMTDWVVFHTVVCQVDLYQVTRRSGSDFDRHFSQLHVHSFASFGSDTTFEDAFGCAVVSLDRCRV